jgi:Zn-dependent M16 (insulinase) family peptidase
MTEVSTMQAPKDNNPAPQSTHPAFEWKRSQSIPSLRLVMEEYSHRVTGAVHYHLSSDNPENVFLVAFRTVPMDSTGVAHILEHTALCGSKRYPVRDPFFMMIRRSLNTFMNAFTSSDWTAYPFASKNRKDFNNLLHVYLDAAFFPRLHKLDFAQEGHRLEFSETENPQSELLFKGVVYNEMKGAMSSTNSVLWQTMSKYLFPTSTYHFNSGGEPDEIPDLSYDQLVNFCKTHYHPSNSVFMTFGDIPAYEHQQAFEELALSDFEKLDVNIEVSDEKRYLSSIKVEEFYAADNATKSKSHIVMGWLLGRSTELDDLFKAQLLCSVLMDNSASPLLRALETSSLGTSPSPLCGLEDSNREMSFMAGLEGCETSATAEVENLIRQTLLEICQNGVPQEQVEAALHQLELSQREISGDGYPYGLQLILAGLSTATHRGDPIQLLDIDPVLEDLHEQIKDENFIPTLIKDLLLDNCHQVTLTLKPDPELVNRKVQSELQRLASIKASLSDQQRNQIIADSRDLAQRQSREDDPGLLPKVGLEDVPKELTEPQRIDLKANNCPVSYYAQGTNGLSYQQVVMQLPELDQELLDLLPLYTSCLTEFGVGEKDYAEVQVWQSRISGGLNCFSSIHGSMQDEQKTHGVLAFSSKSLVSNHAALSDLIHETIQHVRFDEDQRLRELIEQICARKESSITAQGHSLAMSLASSRMSPTAQLNHRFGGLAGIQRLKLIRDQMADAAPRSKMLDGFRRIHQLVLQADRQFLLIAEKEQQQNVLGELNKAWDGAQIGNSSAPFTLPAIRENIQQAWTTSTQVNFCAKAYATVPSDHEDNAVLHVLAGFMRNGYLHRAIREQGGAYGGGAAQDANSASFRFFSYRDPRLSETLDDFDRAIEWVISENHPPHQLEEAILGVIATMDKPSSPAGEAKQAFYNRLFGRTIAHRMEFRTRVLNTSIADLKAAATRYFDTSQASIGVIGNREAIDAIEMNGMEIKNL